METVFLAVVGAVYADGVTLIMDGETVATQKHYKYNKNKNAKFMAGDRVVVLRTSGTYVVAFKI